MKGEKRMELRSVSWYFGVNRFAGITAMITEVTRHQHTQHNSAKPVLSGKVQAPKDKTEKERCTRWA